MHPIHDTDPVLLLAVAMASKRRPAELLDLVTAIHLLQHAVPAATKLADALTRLSTHGLIEAAGDGAAYRLTAAGETLAADLPRKADTDAKLFTLRTRLAEHRGRGDAVSVREADLATAVAAHAALLADGTRSLLVPKAPPPEDNGRGPGYHLRKPAPAKKRPQKR